MKTIRTNGLHPSQPTGDQRDMEPQFGLTKREEFAKAALQGICQSFTNDEGHELNIAERYARQAVRCADALLKALNEPTI